MRRIQFEKPNVNPIRFRNILSMNYSTIPMRADLLIRIKIPRRQTARGPIKITVDVKSDVNAVRDIYVLYAYINAYNTYIGLYLYSFKSILAFIRRSSHVNSIAVF